MVGRRVKEFQEEGGHFAATGNCRSGSMGCPEMYTPSGVVNEDTGGLLLTIGSAAKTSDIIVDALPGQVGDAVQLP